MLVVGHPSVLIDRWWNSPVFFTVSVRGQGLFKYYRATTGQVMMMMMMMTTMFDSEHLHDVKHFLSLHCFINEADCSLMGFWNTICISIILLVYEQTSPLPAKLSVMRACLLPWTQETKYCGWESCVMEARVAWDSVFFCN